jgi:hypothetical protein
MIAAYCPTTISCIYIQYAEYLIKQPGISTHHVYQSRIAKAKCQRGF